MIHQEAMCDTVCDLRVTTERVVIRRFQQRDWDIAWAHEKDIRIMRYIREIPDDALLTKRLNTFLAAWPAGEGDWLGLTVSLKNENPDPDSNSGMIGILALRIESLENQQIEIGYRFHPDYHGQGYAHEACRWLMNFLETGLQAHKIVAYSLAENETSWALLEKLAMQREAHFREHCWLDGRWQDEYGYARIF